MQLWVESQQSANSQKLPSINLVLSDYSQLKTVINKSFKTDI